MLRAFLEPLGLETTMDTPTRNTGTPRNIANTEETREHSEVTGHVTWTGWNLVVVRCMLSPAPLSDVIGELTPARSLGLGTWDLDNDHRCGDRESKRVFQINDHGGLECVSVGLDHSPRLS